MHPVLPQTASDSIEGDCQSRSCTKVGTEYVNAYLNVLILHIFSLHFSMEVTRVWKVLEETCLTNELTEFECSGIALQIRKEHIAAGRVLVILH